MRKQPSFFLLNRKQKHSGSPQGFTAVLNLQWRNTLMERFM